MRKIIDILKIFWFFLIPYSLWRGSRKLKKWLKKNKKQQNPNLYPFNERWKVIRKKVKSTLFKLNVKVEVEGEDYILKGGMLITPNHSSNFDPFYLINALGAKTEMASVSKIELEHKKMINGYMYGTDSFFIDRTKIRESLVLLKGAINYAKKNQRSIVIFPEGTRSSSTELLPFHKGLFGFAQQYALPILPVTIVGTLQAKRWWIPKQKIVKVIIHKPIKPIEHIKIPKDILTRRVQKIIQSGLDNYEKQLSSKKLEELNNLKKYAKQKSKKEKIN